MGIRAGAWLAATSLSLSFVIPDLAQAQAASPPARVGRLASLQGSVSFHDAQSNGWTQAVPNTPVTNGDAVFAQAGGHAEVDVGNGVVELDGGTELDIATLDDQQFVTSAPQGRMFLALGPQAPGAVNQVATPRGVLQIAGQGEYEIVAGDSATPTTVTVVQGGGQVTATGVQLAVGAGQTATITGTDQLSGGVAPAGPPDPFLSAMLATVARQNGQLPSQVANMTGCRALAQVGTWRQSPQYGQVWYPPVQSGWAPYREGHWAYVQPWGWTWIDDSSWGFAPFHYGRWIDEGGQWGWVPDGGGEPVEGYAEPVYSPALVSWTDIGAAALAGAAIGAAIGWVALAPNEPYYPPYREDRGYFNRINRLDVHNISSVTFNRVAVNNFGSFANRRGAVFAPRDALLRGQPMAQAARPFTPAAFQQARPIEPGRTPLGAPPPGAARGAPAQGPAINAAAFHPQHLQGGHLPLRAGGPAAGSPAAFHAGVPALRPHSEVITGRPGATPPPVERGGGAAPAPGHEGHAGAIAGAAAGVAGAGLAAHTLAGHQEPERQAPGRPAPERQAPGRQVEPRVETPRSPQHAEPRPAVRPPVQHAAAPRAAERAAPPRVERPAAPRPAEHFVAPRPAARPEVRSAPPPAPRPAPRPAPARHEPEHH